MSIKIKFAVFISALIVAIISASSAFLYYAEKEVLIKQLEKHQKSLVSGLAQIARESLLVGDDLILINYANLLKRTNAAVAEAFVVNKKKIIIAHTDAAMLGRRLKDEGSVEDYTTVGEPVLFGKDIEAECFVKFSRRELNKIYESGLAETRRRVFAVAAVSLLAGLLGSWLFAHFMTGPIKMLAQSAEIVGGGDLSHKVNIVRNDELGDLARHFNEMIEKLKELDEMKKDFVSSVTHELRSPLGAVETYVNLLLSKNPEYEKENFLRIQGNIARLRNFINDLLDIAKMEKGKMEISKMPFNLDAAIEDIAELFRPQALEKNIVIDFEQRTSGTKVNADEERIRQVVTNLVSNAMKFTPDGGKITVRTESVKREAEKECSGGIAIPQNMANSSQVKSLDKVSPDTSYVQVSVSDTGIGIPTESLEKIFEKFEQVKKTRTRVKGPKGTGLGLAIAKSIVELHGGRIWAQSPASMRGADDEEAMGTTFYFTLPLDDSTAKDL